MNLARQVLLNNSTRHKFQHDIEPSTTGPLLYVHSEKLKLIDEDKSMSVSKDITSTRCDYGRHSALLPVQDDILKRRSRASTNKASPVLPALFISSPKQASLQKPTGRKTDSVRTSDKQHNITRSVDENNMNFQNVADCMASRPTSSCTSSLDNNSIDLIELSPEIKPKFNSTKTFYEMSLCRPRPKDQMYHKMSLAGSSTQNKHEVSNSTLGYKNEYRVGLSGSRPDTLSRESSSSTIKSMDDSISNITPLTTKPIDSDDEVELPATQPALGTLLQSVIAYVEVRTGNDNRSWGVKDQMRRLGATIVDRFTKNVTHVVFKEGSMATYNKALRLKVFLVSVLWIEECKIARTIVSENLYPPSDMERYESPHLYPKLRKVKSMQPDFENKREAEYFKRKRRKRLPVDNLEQENKILDLLYPTKPRVNDDSPSFLRALKCVAVNEPGYEDYIKGESIPSSSDEDDPPPLAIRLLKEYMQSPLRAKPNSPQPQPQQTSSVLKQIDSDVALPVSTPSNSDPTQQNSKSHHIEQHSKTPPKSNVRFNFLERMSSVQNEFSKLLSPLDETCRNAPMVIDGAQTELPVLLKSPTQSLDTLPVRRRSLRHEVLFIKTQTLTVTKQITDSFTSPKKGNLRRSGRIASNSQQESLPPLPTSTQRRRKLLNITQPDDSPVLITPSIDDDHPIIPKYPYTPPKSRRKSAKHTQSPVDMDLTDVVPGSNIILLNTAAKNASLKARANSQPASTRNEEDRNGCTSRRSSMCFKKKSLKDMSLSSQSFIKTRQVPTIVLTSLHRDDIKRVSDAIKVIGGFELEEKVSSKTSHVVTNLPVRRTLNLLKGIARGCWIVKQDWVLKSHDQGKWIDEEKYEFTEFSPTVQQYRFEKLAFGPAFKPDLFSSSGLIFVCKNTSPSPKDLTELITLCGGRVTANAHNADVVVGLYSPDLRRACLKESWVLDSITDGSTKSMEDYTIQRGV